MAISITPIDFTIITNGGLRTASQQMALYKRGASNIDGRSSLSKHQKQSDGWGHAVDLVPWVGRSPRWEWPLIYPIAAAMATCAPLAGVELRWGGVWDRRMKDFAYEIKDEKELSALAEVMRREVRAYTVRHPGPDFIDGPHYEISKLL